MGDAIYISNSLVKSKYIVSMGLVEIHKSLKYSYSNNCCKVDLCF